MYLYKPKLEYEYTWSLIPIIIIHITILLPNVPGFLLYISMSYLLSNIFKVNISIIIQMIELLQQKQDHHKICFISFKIE